MGDKDEVLPEVSPNRVLKGRKAILITLSKSRFGGYLFYKAAITL